MQLALPDRKYVSDGNRYIVAIDRNWIISFFRILSYRQKCLYNVRKRNRNVLIFISANSNHILIISMERYWFYREKCLSELSSNFSVLRPPRSEKTVFTKVSVYLSVRRLITR